MKTIKGVAYDDDGGRWVTIGGRRVYIRPRQTLSEAMIQSGKFNNNRYTKENIDYVEEDKNHYVLHNNHKIEYLTKKEYDNACEKLNNTISEDDRATINSYIDSPSYAGSSELNANSNGTYLRKYLWNDKEENKLSQYEYDKQVVKAYENEIKSKDLSDWRVENEVKWKGYELGYGDWGFTKYNIDELKSKIKLAEDTDKMEKIKELYNMEKRYEDNRRIAEKNYKGSSSFWTSKEYDEFEKSYNNEKEYMKSVCNKYDIPSNLSSYGYKNLIDYVEKKNAIKAMPESERKYLTLKEMLDRRNTKEFNYQPDKTIEEINSVNNQQQKMDKVFNDKGIQFDKDIIVFRRGRENEDEIKNGFEKWGYTSTTLKDSLPKKMPSGNSFGDKEEVIIIPKGTKVLPLKEIINNREYRDEYDLSNIRSLARQNEILLPRNGYYKYLKYDWKTNKWVVVLERKDK